MLRKMGISYCCFSHSEEISLILKINIDVKVAQNRKKLTHTPDDILMSAFTIHVNPTPQHTSFFWINTPVEC